jgi:hypothetical protein
VDDSVVCFAVLVFQFGDIAVANEDRLGELGLTHF